MTDREGQVTVRCGDGDGDGDGHSDTSSPRLQPELNTASSLELGAPRVSLLLVLLHLVSLALVEAVCRRVLDTAKTVSSRGGR